MRSSISIITPVFHFSQVWIFQCGQMGGKAEWACPLIVESNK